VRLEELCKLKKSTSSGPEHATFRLVVCCLNQLRYRVPRHLETLINILISENIFLNSLYLKFIFVFYNQNHGPGKLSRYSGKLQAGWLGFNSRQRQKHFLRSVKTGSGAYPASYPMGTGSSFPRFKAPGPLTSI
jgi:hypothetical protein